MTRGERPPTQQRYERTLRIEATPPFTKRQVNEWIFRHIGLPINRHDEYALIALSTALYLQHELNELDECRVPKGCIETAIRSWVQNDGQMEDISNRAGVIVIAPNCSAFMMTQKNLLQQNPASRGKLSLFETSMFANERPRSAACRAFAQETFTPNFFKHETLHIAEVILSEELRRVQWPGTYSISSFAVFLKEWNQWHRLLEELVENGLTESSLAIITRDAFEEVLLPQEIAIPGKHFLSSHHRIIQHILKAYDRALHPRPQL